MPSIQMSRVILSEMQGTENNDALALLASSRQPALNIFPRRTCVGIALKFLEFPIKKRGLISRDSLPVGQILILQIAKPLQDLPALIRCELGQLIENVLFAHGHSLALFPTMLKKPHARMGVITSPATSVSRKLRPLWK